MDNSKVTSWVCSVCGYVHQGDQPPDMCPVCGADALDFDPVEPIEQAPVAPHTAWRCLNCSYIANGAAAPKLCPVCGARQEKFEPVEPEHTIQQQTTGGNHILIIGGGIAGVAAAEAARSASSHTGNITLVCREPVPPYYRLNLTRYLAAEIERETLPIHPNEWYAERSITVQPNLSVEAMNREQRKVTLSNGEQLSYDVLILAMGSHAFVPPLEGANLPGVRCLRTLEDADYILQQADATGKAIVIGGGILGIETAGALAARGTDVTLIESHAWLMPHQLNPKAAERLEQHMDRLGINLLKQVRPVAITGSDAADGVLLDTGETVPASLIILTTGVRPNTHLARKAELNVHRGIVVNNFLQTSDSSIYAVGDVAEHNGELYGTWAPSQYQGTIAGLNAAGTPTQFGGVPRSNALKVLGIDLLSIGCFEPPDGSYLVLQHEESHAFAHFVFRDGKLVGSILLGFAKLGSAVKHAVEKETDFSLLLKADPTGAEVMEHLRTTQI